MRNLNPDPHILKYSFLLFMQKPNPYGPNPRVCNTRFFKSETWNLDPNFIVNAGI
jgi:hypothetical protein